MKRSRSGFTMAEMLIVVAIVGVLVAISIPIFITQMEKSRESVDLANARSLYAEVMVSAINDDGRLYDSTNKVYTATIQPIVQKQDDWSINTDNLSIGGVSSSNWEGIPGAGGSCTVKYNPATQIVKIIWSGGSSGSEESSGDSGETNTNAAHKKDYDDLFSLGKKVLEKMDNSELSNNGITVTIRISKNGICTVSLNKTDPNFNENTVYDYLQNEAKLIDSNHKFTLQSNDVDFTVEVHHNNGNDKGVKVTPKYK